MAFNPILNPEDFQVNHKNGCRYNNCLYNLEWVTPKENNKHSINYLRQDSDIMYLNINQAYEIGRMIKENQLTAKQIAEVFGCSENQVYAIHQGISFREVYDYYQLYNINMGLKCRRYEDKVAKVKEMLHNNIPIYRIAKELGISRSVVYSIRDGESYRGEYEYNV